MTPQVVAITITSQLRVIPRMTSPGGALQKCSTPFAIDLPLTANIEVTLIGIPKERRVRGHGDTPRTGVPVAEDTSRTGLTGFWLAALTVFRARGDVTNPPRSGRRCTRPPAATACRSTCGVANSSD